MTFARLLSITGSVGIVVAFGCGSSSSGHSGGGTGGGTFINLDGGLGTIPAQNTPDGLQKMTQAQADQMNAAACQGWQGEAESGPAVLEFQVDITGSMGEQAPSTGGQSKLAATQTALPQAFANLPATWAVGLTFFNRPNGCYQGRQAVPIAPLTQAQQTALSTAVRNQSANGYTPTEAAYLFALGQVQNWNATPDYTSSHRYVVLVTDGIPTVDRDGCTLGSGPQNCITDAEYSHLIATVGSQTAATGIKTFVVGVPGSEDPQGAMYDPMYKLSLVAQAGGTSKTGCTAVSGTSNGNQVNPRGTYCHYDMTQSTNFAADLVSTIGVIAGQAISCDYKVPAAPAGQTIDPNKTNMIYDDGNGNTYLVLPNQSPTCDRGWHFTDSTNTAITVCQITCDLLKASTNPNAKITLVFGCDTPVPVY
jgi:hypothetical protein